MTLGPEAVGFSSALERAGEASHVLYWGYIGIMEKKLETTKMGLIYGNHVYI